MPMRPACPRANSRCFTLCALFVALHITVNPFCAEAQGTSAFIPGRITERVATLTGTDLSYALYLPSAYPGERVWPVAFIMDPRGRALLPLQCFQAAAERYGWILLSSYDTRSDSGPEPTVQALNAMLEDAQRRFAVDRRRFYLIGFSGTAQLSLDIAIKLGDPIAGTIGVGGSRAPLTPQLLESAHPFAFFGAAGVRDFNYDEVMRLDSVLDGSRIPHRVREFEGGHQWLPPELCDESIGWLEAQAMRAGRRSLDGGLLGDIVGREIESARALERAGASVAALLLYREIIDDYREWAPAAWLTAARERLVPLESASVVRAALDRRGRLRNETTRYVRRLSDYLVELRRSPLTVPEPAQVLRSLDVERLQKEVRASKDTERAVWASRMLEMVWTTLSFYEPRVYLTSHEAARALTLLRSARRIYPERRLLLYREARALSELGRTDEARAAIAEAVSAGVPIPAADDVWLGSLPPDARFRELLREAK